MYPFRAIIIGGSEAERSSIRREITNLGVAIDQEFDDIDKVISEEPLLGDAKCFFIVKVNSRANMEQLSRLNRYFMGKPIVALLNQDSDLFAVLNTERAGAAQVLLLPFQPEHLRAALDAITRQFGCPSTSSKVIAVLGASEGCGSTTLAINLSDSFASEHNKNCILVELAVHFGRLGGYLNVEPTTTVTDLLAGEKIFEVNAINQALVRVADKFNVLAASHHTVDRRSIAPARVLALIASIRQMADVIVLDLPYTFNDLYFKALSVSDQIVMMARPNPPSIQALRVISESLATWAHGATQNLVINCYGPRAEEFTETQLRAALAAERIWTIADDPEAFKTAVTRGQLLHEESPRTRAWPGISALASQLMGPEAPLAAKQKTTSWPLWVTNLFH